jgi:hypothetical protein
MPLIHCSEQGRQTLQEFYSEWASSTDKISANIGRSMLGVIELINKVFLETKIYGLTSHAHLLLLSKDDSKSDLFVAIITNGLKNFILNICYLRTNDRGKMLGSKGQQNPLKNSKNI